MKPFSESLRYSYNLTPHSVVIDVGAHEANWSLGMWRRYGCRVIALEPVREFYWGCVQRTVNTPIQVLPFALGRMSGETNFGVHGSMSGILCDGPQQSVRVITFSSLLVGLNIQKVDVLKINAESSEFDILENIISGGFQSCIVNLAVQFHNQLPDAEERRRKIFEELSKTHELEWDEPWVWTGWKLK